MREICGNLLVTRLNRVEYQRPQRIDASHAMHDLKVECIGWRDALAAPRGLHNTVPAKSTRKNSAPTRAVARYEDHVAKFPAIVRMPAYITAKDPAILSGGIFNAHNPSIENAENLDE